MRHLFFDLDGTLTDPGLGITNSVSYALRRFGIQPPPREALYCFIGPPLTDSFQRFFGFSPEKALDAVAAYREYYAETGIFENAVYPGIQDLLSGLRDMGKILVLATSKPQPYAEKILSHYDLARYFSFVSGASMDERKATKAAVVQAALDLTGADPEDCLMIGDREHDVLGAAVCGIRTLGVLYGYGTRSELEAAGAWGIAETVRNLEEQLHTL